MALRKVLAACAALALVGVDASRCRPHSSHAISSSTVTESSTVITSSSAIESSTATSTTVSEQASSSTTVSEEVSSSTTQSSEASSSTVDSSATSTTSTVPTSTGYLSNPGFDNNGAGWTLAGQASINDYNWYHDAVGAALLSVTETGQDAGSSISTPLRNLVPGQDYEVSMYWSLNWWWGPDVCSYVFYIDDQDFTSAVQTTSGWVQLSTSFTAPKADPELKIQLWCSAIPDNGESDWEPLVNAYIDDVAIVESN